MDDLTNQIMANLVFDIDEADAQLKTLENKVGQSSARMQEMLDQMENTGISTFTEQQAQTLSVLQNSISKKLAASAKSERELTEIYSRGSRSRQAIAQKEAKDRLAIAADQVQKEKLLNRPSQQPGLNKMSGGFSGLISSSGLADKAKDMAVSAGKEIVSTITEVETAMLPLAHAAEGLMSDLNDMRDELMQLGAEYGQTFNVTSDIAGYWAQAGYNVQDTLELTKDTLIALNTTQLDSTYATQGLVDIMAQWDIEADNLLPVIDKINITADKYTISSKDLIDGLTQTGQVAKDAGLSIDETIGAITVLHQASGKTGAELGTVFRGILDSMTGQKTVDLMESLGIQMFTDKARTSFRSLADLMEELSAKWQEGSGSNTAMVQLENHIMGQMNRELAAALGLGKEWNDIQQQELGTTQASISKRNFFISLMSKFLDIQAVVNNQLNAEGYSLRENERVMGTLEKQTEVLRAAAEALAVAIGDAGLLDDLKGLVEGAIDAVQWFNNLDDGMQTALVTFAEVTVAVRLLSTSLKAVGVGGAMAGLGSLMSGWAVPLTATTAAARTLQTVTTGLTTAFKNLGKGLIGTLGGPWVAAAIGIGTAIGVIYKETKKAKEESIEHGKTAEKLVSDYDKLQEKIGNLKEGTEAYEKVNHELKQLHSDIGNALPEVVDGYDEVNGKLDINIDKLYDMAETGKEYKGFLQDEEEHHRAIIDVLQEEIIQHRNLADQYKDDADKLPNLLNRREELKNAIDNEGESSQKSELLKIQLSETDELIASIAMRAGLTREEANQLVIGSTDDVIQKLRELQIEQLNTEKEIVQSQARETAKAVEQTENRIKAIDIEIGALLVKQTALKEKTSDLHFSSMHGIKYWYNQAKLDNLYEERSEEDNRLNEKKAELEQCLKDIAELSLKIANIDIVYDDTDLGSGSYNKNADLITKALKKLSNTAEQFASVNAGVERAIAKVNRQLEVADSEYDYLADKVERGTATAEDYARMQEIVGDKIMLITREQDQLTQANEQYRSVIDTLRSALTEATRQYEQFQNAGDAEHASQAANAVSNLQNEIQSLSDEISRNTSKIWENKSALDSLGNQSYSQYYQELMSWMNHLEAKNSLTTEQQMEYLQAIDASKLTVEEQRDLSEDLYDTRRRLLDEEMDRIREAYYERKEMYEQEIEANERLIEHKEKRIDAIREEAEEQIAAVQKVIDALDEEAEAEDRNEAEGDHKQRLADLQEERRYHELRTGVEHQDRIAEIDREIAEENHRWELQQNDWARDAQKEAYKDQINSISKEAESQEEALQNEIDELKSANDLKKEELETYYNEIQELFDSNTLDMLAAIGEYDEEFYNKFFAIGQSIRNGLEDGSGFPLDSISEYVSDTEKKHKKLPIGKTPPEPDERQGDENDRTSKQQEAFKKAERARKNLRNAGYGQGADDISGYDYAGAKAWYDRYIDNGRTDLSSQVKRWFKDILNAKKEWEGLAQGGIIPGGRPSLKLLGDAPYDEAVIPLPRLQPMITEAVFQATIDYSRLNKSVAMFNNLPDRIEVQFASGADIDRVIKAIQAHSSDVSIGTLFKADNVGFEDRADMSIFSRELGREVRNVSIANGR